MRPQRFAADHTPMASSRNGRASCFNEAAAIRCGSRWQEQGGHAAVQASMRPQRFAADHRPCVDLFPAAIDASMRPQRFAADHGGKSKVGMPQSKLQ